jgi:hypothetical protein
MPFVLACALNWIKAILNDSEKIYPQGFRKKKEELGSVTIYKGLQVIFSNPKTM